MAKHVKGLEYNFETLRYYNPKYHDNHYKGYTKFDHELIMSEAYTNIELSILLGRSIRSILERKRRIKQGKYKI